MNPYRFPFIGRPFRGMWYYDWQIGPVVWRWKHDRAHRTSFASDKVVIGRFSAWWDSAWTYSARCHIRWAFEGPKYRISVAHRVLWTKWMLWREGR